MSFIKIVVLVVLLIFFFLFFIFCLCKAASRADNIIAKIREKEDH